MRRIIFLVFLGVIYLSGKTQESKLTLIPVYEKTFEDTIVDVIFDTVTVTLEEAKAMGWKEEAFSEEEKAKGEVVVAYPKVIFYGVPDSPVKGKVKRIEFWGKEDNILKVIDVKRDEDVIKSRRENYILIRKKIREESPYSKWEVYTTDGTMVLKKTGEYGIVPVDISDDGYLAMIRYPTFSGGPFGDGFIYDIRGNKIAEIENPIQVDEGWASAEFSDKGIIFGFSDAYRKSVIKLVMKDGVLLGKSEVPLGSYFLLKSNRNVGIVVVFQDNNVKPYQIYVYCIDWDGKIKWKTPLEIGGIVDIEIDSLSKKIYIISWMGYLWVLNSETGDIELVYETHWSKNILKNVDRHYNLPEFVSIDINEKYAYIRGTPWRSRDFTVIFIFDLASKNLKDTLCLPNTVYTRVFRERFYLFQHKKMKILDFNREEVER